MQIETGTETVLAEVVDGVGVITLNRPDRRNALHPEMYDGVPRALERLIREPEVGCIMITGAGRAFCAGGDVRDGQQRRSREGDNVRASAEAKPERRRATVEEAGAALTHQARMVHLLHSSPKVTLAALPGAAVGAGLGIALATDLRIAARSAKLIPGWGQLAFSGDFGGTWFLTRLVGPSKALELLINNTTVDAETALQIGLVNKVVEDDELVTAALEWAKQIAAGPRTTWTLMKQNVLQAERLSLAEALPLESERMARSGQSDDHRAAVNSWTTAAAEKKVAGSGGPRTREPEGCDSVST